MPLRLSLLISVVRRGAPLEQLATVSHTARRAAIGDALAEFLPQETANETRFTREATLSALAPPPGGQIKANKCASPRCVHRRIRKLSRIVLN